MKRIFLLFSFACCAFTQQRNTVYLQLVKGLSAITSNTYSVTNNVGQNYHNFSFVERNTNGSTTCGNDYNQLRFGLVANIQASYDGTNYFQVPNQRVSYAQDSSRFTATKLYRVSGAYPYIRTGLLSFPTSLQTNCVVDINYTGSLEGPNISDSSTPPFKLGNVIPGQTSIPYNSCTTISNGETVAASSLPSLLVNLLGITYMPLGPNTTITVYFGTGCTVGNAITALSSPTGSEVSIPLDVVNFTPISNIPFSGLSSALNMSVLISGSGTTGGYVIFDLVIAN